MAIDWSQVGQNLSTLPGNPLFDLGIGLMANGGAAPYGTTLGQRFAGALQYMGNAQQTLARQRAFQQAQDDAEQDRQAKQQRQADLDKYLKSTPYANDAGFQALAAANPEAAAAYALRQSQADNASPWQFDARSGTMVNTKSGQFKPLTMLQAPGMPGFAAPQPSASGVNASLNGASGQQVSFNFPPGTPPEVIAAAKADAVARGDITGAQAATIDSQNVAPQGAPTQTPAPTTLAQYEAMHDAQRAALPAGYEWNADHTAAERIPGLPAPKNVQDGVAQRVQTVTEQNQWLAQHGLPALSKAQEQAVMQTGQIPLLNPDATHRAAIDYLAGGTKALGRWYGASGPATQAAIHNEAAQVASSLGLNESDILSVRGRNHAVQGALDNLTKQNAVISRQSEAMENNMQVAEGYLQKLGNGNYPTVNAMLNAVKTQMGNSDYVALKTALNSVAQDYGKIMSGSTGASGANEADLAQARQLMNGNFNPAQISSVFDVIRRDSAGQLKAAQDKEQDAQKLLGSFKLDNNAPTSSSPAGAHPGYPDGTRLNGPGGKTYIVQNGVPIPESP